MPFKCFVGDRRGIRDRIEDKLRKGAERKYVLSRGTSYIAPEKYASPPNVIQDSQWGNLPPELLLDIIKRVEASETSWPGRRNVVSCAAVCRLWREATKEVVKTPEQCGLLTFPMSLKQPGPRDAPIQCYIKRERATSTYHLFLGLSPALAGEASKLLMAAKKIRKATKTEFLISLVADEFSRGTDTCVGKLRSNFLGTKFVIYDSLPPCNPAVQRNCWSHPKFRSKKVSPRLPVVKYNAATILYELNVLRTRGPRRMQCTMHWIPLSAVQEGGTAPAPATFENSLDEEFTPLPVSKEKNQELICATAVEPLESISSTRRPLVLKNKAPRWHEQLQCWCLNFKGRVTVASVKNFQLVAAFDPSQNIPAAEQDKVILQFGKIGKDIFTMDYCYPLSAFQAFAICLSSFDTKPACE